MALRYPLWFLGECLDEERGRTQLGHLASRALDLGLKRTDSTRGHVFQALGAAQGFFDEYPKHKLTISRASPSEPYKPKGPVLSDWKRFLTTKKGEYGQARLGFQYNYNTLKGYLTPQYGGHRTGGGGGDNEFEIVLRLLAGF
jgi:hypothetical protein